MRPQSFILAVLLGTTATTAWSSTSFATPGQATIPGTACRMVSGNWVEVSGTSFLGTELTNNSSSTLYAICPVMMDTGMSYYYAAAYGDQNSMPSACVMYYSYGVTSQWTAVAGSIGAYGPVRYSFWSSIPSGIQSASIDCPMGGHSVLYDVFFYHY